MLMQFDPFREFDRLAEQLAAGARMPAAVSDGRLPARRRVRSSLRSGVAPGTPDLTVEQNAC